MSGHVVAHSIEMHPFSTEVAPRLKDGVATGVIKHSVVVVVVVLKENLTKFYWCCSNDGTCFNVNVEKTALHWVKSTVITHF